MIILTLQIPEEVAAEYYQAAETLNRRMSPNEVPRIDAKSLMAFALAGHSAEEMANQFDLALRIATQRDELPHPVLS